MNSAAYLQNAEEPNVPTVRHLPTGDKRPKQKTRLVALAGGADCTRKNNNRTGNVTGVELYTCYHHPLLILNHEDYY
jgi:hypothetical protein